MVYPRRKSFIAVDAGSVALGGSAEYAFKRQPRRLEAIKLRVTATASNDAATSSKITARFGIIAALKRITFHVNDKQGGRNVIDVSGPNLLSYLINTGQRIDRNTLYAMLPGLVQSAAYTFTLTIPFRHGQIAEPFGNLLSIPLNNAEQNEEPVLKVDFSTDTELLSAGSISNFSMTVQAVYRQVPVVGGDGKPVPYICQELSKKTFAPTSAEGAIFEWPTAGILTSANLQTYNKTSFANALALASGGRYQLQYGVDIMEETDDLFQEQANDASRDTYPAVLSASTQLPNMQPQKEALFDFFTEDEGWDSYSVLSCPVLDSETLGGDTLKLKFNNYGSTNNQTEITSHYLLPMNREEIKSLVAML